MKIKTHTLIRKLSPIALVATALAISPTAQAQNATWVGNNGTSTPSWGAFNNWNTGAAPTFSNTTNLTFNSSAVPIPNSWLGANRIVRSIEFGADVDAAMGVNLQDFNFGVSRNMTMDTDTVGGNATISVLSGSTGNITFGNATSTGGTIGNIILADNLLVDHNGTGLLSFNRGITGAGFSVTKTGTGTMVFNSTSASNNTFSGNMNINQGRLIASAFGVATDLNAAANINMGGGTLEFRNGTGANKDYNTVGFNVNSASTLAYTNLYNTTYTLTFSGTSSFNLGANLTVQNLSSNTTLANNIIISRNMTGSGSITVETYNNVASGADNFALGRLLLTGNNTGWSGDLIIRAGTATLGGNSTLGSGVNVNAGTGSIVLGETGNMTGAGMSLGAAVGGGAQTVNNNIIVRTGGYRGIRGSSDHSYTLNGNITLEGDLNVHNALFFTDKSITLNGNISGAGGLNFTESGNPAFMRLSGNNTYTGATTIGTNATLSLFSTTHQNAIGDTSAVSFTGPASTMGVSSNETIGSLASTGGNGAVLIGANLILTTGANNASTSYSGSITGNNSVLTKVGSGTQTLTGAVNLAGGTLDVQAGTLLLTSTASLSNSTVLVSTGATLDASALPVLTIASGEFVGGDGSLTGNLSLATGAQLVFNIGTTFSVTGSVAFGTGFGVDDLVGLSGAPIDWSSIALGTYTLIDTTTTNFALAGLDNFGLGNAADIGGGKFAYFDNGSLDLVVIPEPTTWALLAACLTAVVVLRRRRSGSMG